MKILCKFNHWGGQGLRFMKMTKENVTIREIYTSSGIMEVWLCNHCRKVIFKKVLSH